MYFKTTLNNLENCPNLKFGDVILFQIYSYPNDKKHEAKNLYIIRKPVLAVFLGYSFVDMAIGFEYVEYYDSSNNTIEKKYELKEYIEWYDTINILHCWKSFPNFRELLKAYRKHEKRKKVSSKELIYAPKQLIIEKTK